ncbi:hypothetical protein LguiA_030225 [Lonicera macranthoides]
MIWDDKVDVIDDGKVVEEEVKFLSHMKYDPNLAKLIGFCSNGYCSGGTSEWVKVAFEFGKLLQCLYDGIDHEQWLYLVFNIDSTNIMLD